MPIEPWYFDYHGYFLVIIILSFHNDMLLFVCARFTDLYLKHSIIPPSLTPYFSLQQAIFHSMHLNLKSQKEPGLDRIILVDTQGKLSWVNGTNGGDHHLCPRKKKKENLSCQGPV